MPEIQFFGTYQVAYSDIENIRWLELDKIETTEMRHLDIFGNFWHGTIS